MDRMVDVSLQNNTKGYDLEYRIDTIIKPSKKLGILTSHDWKILCILVTRCVPVNCTSGETV